MDRTGRIRGIMSIAIINKITVQTSGPPARSIADRERFLHWQVAFPGVWQRWQDASPRGGFDAVIGNPPWDRIKLQEVEWFSSRRPELGAGSDCCRAAGRYSAGCAADGDPLVQDFDDAKERADRMGQIVPRLRSLPAARRRRHQPVLAVRGAGDESSKAGRNRGAAHAVRHIRGQDSSAVLQVGLHDGAGVVHTRLREPSARNRSAAVLQGRSLRRFKFCALIFGGAERRFDGGGVRVLYALMPRL